MKKAYLLIIAAALAFAGCSKDGAEHSDPNAWMYDESLPVPVLMGNIGAVPLTKAIVETDDFSGIPFGVFGLDVSNGQDSWTYSGAYNKSDRVNSILLNNEAATVTDGKVAFTNGTMYYPLNSDNNFNFYAYYPRKSTNTNLSCNDGTYISANYNIGYDDILWAEAKAEDFTYTKETANYKISGFNAAYVRKVNEYGQLETYLPKLVFEHKLTALKFKLLATTEVAQALKDAGAEITGLTIDDTYTKGSLIIAAKDEQSQRKSGEFNPDETSQGGSIQLRTGNKSSFSITDISSQQDLDNDESTYTIDFGDELLLVPHPESKCFEGRLHIKLSGITQDIPIKLSDPNPDKNFEPGMRYTYTIKVKGPEEIVAYAELTEWKDTDCGVVETEEEGEPTDE